MRRRIRFVQPFQGARRRFVQSPAIGGQQSFAGDLADPLVREVEPLADHVKDPAGHELVDALGGVRRAQFRRPLQEREVELPADDAGHRRQTPAALGEPLEPAADELAHPRRRQHFAFDVHAVHALEGAHRLQHHERVALAGAPDFLAESLEGGLLGSRPHQRPDESHRLGLGEGAQGRREEPWLAPELGNRSSQDGHVHDLLHAEGADDEHRPVDHAPAEEHEEPKRHLVRPVQILQNDHERRGRGQMLHGPGHRLEEADVVLGRGRLSLRPAELGEQPSELRAPLLVQLFDRSRDDLPGAECIDPRSERQDLLAFVPAAGQDLAAPFDRVGDERLEQSRLADAGLTLDQADRSATAPRIAKPLPQGVELDPAPDQSGAGSWHWRWTTARAFDARCAGPSLEKLAVELPGLSFGLDAELALESFDARLVLSEGCAAPALTRVQAHERPVHRLLRRIQPEQPYGGLYRSIDGTGPGQVAQ